MTVILQTKIAHYNVLSSDAWPESNIVEGATLHVIDTGEEYIYHDETWETDLRRINALRSI